MSPHGLQLSKKVSTHWSKAWTWCRKLKSEGDEIFFDYGIYNGDDLEEDDDTSLATIVRCILSSPKVEGEDWRTSIFQMLVRCGNQAHKFIINGGSCITVVSTSVVEHLKLLHNNIPNHTRLDGYIICLFRQHNAALFLFLVKIMVTLFSVTLSLWK